MKYIKNSLLFISVIALQGCVAATGALVITGASIASDERALSQQIDDQSIEFRANGALSDNRALNAQAHLNVISVNSSILVVGQVPTPHLKEQALMVLNKVEGINKIHDQIRISNVTSMTTRTNDIWLTSKVKSNLIASHKLDATNIKVVTENSEVFLMGLVSANESKIAVNITRHTGGVARVYKMFELIN